MSARTLVIANPVSGGGSARRALARVDEVLRDLLGPLDLVFTQAPYDAERLAREAVRAGVERLVVAGGDGTFSEVVTGLLSADLAGYAEVALLPLGTGVDLARSLAISRDPTEALEAIVRQPARRIDAGCVRYTDGERERTRYFANATSIGISGLVTELVNRASKKLGGRLSFLSGTLRAIVRHRPSPVTIRVDGRTVHEGPLVLATAANGRYFGAGMQVAPEARLDDGLLDVVTIPGMSRARLMTRLPKLYRGTHLEVPEVSLHRGAEIEADAEPGAVWFETDGEPLGTLPIRIRVMPGVLRMLGCGP